MRHIGKRKAELGVFLLLCGIWLGVFPARIGREAALPAAVIEEIKPILVIDPGHGGADGGACGLHGTVEAAINWSIAEKLRYTAAFLGIPAVMTRETEDIDYPAQTLTVAARKKWDTYRRVETVNTLPGAVLLSIHQNVYPSGTPCGSEVLFGKVDKSRDFAEILQKNLTETLNPQNRRVSVPARRDIYLMEHVGCPAVLVECGFLSNERESVLLGTEEYKMKIAAILAASFLQYTEEFDP